MGFLSFRPFRSRLKAGLGRRKSKNYIKSRSSSPIQESEPQEDLINNNPGNSEALGTQRQPIDISLRQQDPQPNCEQQKCSKTDNKSQKGDKRQKKWTWHKKKGDKESKVIGIATLTTEHEVGASVKPEQTTLEVTTTAHLEDDLTTNSNYATELDETNTNFESKGKKENDEDERLFPMDLQILLDRKCSLRISPVPDLPSGSPIRGGYVTVHYLEGIDQRRYDDHFDRLATYAKKFQSVYMTGCELATAGFISASFTTKSPDQVLCVWCGLTLWQFGDHVNALAIHQSHNRRNCSFLQKRSQGADSSRETPTQSEQGVLVTRTTQDNSESLALSGDTKEVYLKLKEKKLSCIYKDIAQESPYMALSSMKYEKLRRKTFISSLFSQKMSDILAAEGFYLKVDRIMCGICEADILATTSFTTLDKLKLLHHEQRSHCRLETNVPYLFTEHWSQSSRDLKFEDSLSEYAELGVETSQSEHKEMAVENRRENSFLTHPRPTELDINECAKAGLFFNGKNGMIEDGLLCFHCGVEMFAWRSNEDPWIRHARCSPQCQYLILQKGQEYVDSILELHGEYRTSSTESRINNVTTRMLRPRMDAPVIQQAIHDMKLNRDSVKVEISKRIKGGQRDFQHLEEIVRAIHENEPTPVPNHILHSSLTLPQAEILTDTPQPPTPPSPPTPPAPPSPPSLRNSRASSMTSLHSEHDEPVAADITTQLTCKVCLTKLVGIIFLPCGHLVCCTECAPAMSMCPICRNDVKGTIRAHI